MQINKIQSPIPAQMSHYSPRPHKNFNENVSFKSLGEGQLAEKLAKSKFIKWLLPAANKNTLAIEAMYAVLITCMLRPAITLMTPAETEEDKEKNKFRAAHAIASGILGYIFTMCVSHPMSDSVDKVMNTKLTDGTYKYIKKYTSQLTENGGRPFKELAKRLHQPVFMPLRGMLTVAIVPPILSALGLSKSKNDKTDTTVKSAENKQPAAVINNFSKRIPATQKGVTNYANK